MPIHRMLSPRSWKQKAGHGFGLLGRIFGGVWRLLSPIQQGIRRRLRHTSWGNVAANGVLGLILLVVVGGVSGAILLAWLSATLGDPAKLLESIKVQSTKIYDRTGTVLLYEVSGDEKRTIIPLTDIPKHVQQATIAVEDRKFYEHKGIRPTSIVRAVLYDVFTGTRGQGGSTITQQLVKNTILSKEKRLTRKIKEWFLSYQIERKLSKDEILGYYFNEIPYGNTAHGIESASQQFFGKAAKDLDLAEGAMLAALPQAPTRYSPYGNHTDELEARRKLILELMREQGFIDQAQADAAKATDVLARIQPRRDMIKAPHFVIYVRELLAQKYGETYLTKSGLKVITSLDATKQEAAEKAVTDGIAAIERSGGSNAALVSLDPKTGEILAMVGSRDYFDDEHDGNVNVVLRPRQPGSSFKPIVYTAAFAKGYTPSTVLYDVNTIFKTDSRNYEPKNYDLKEHGPVTVRTALQGSLNIPAVKMLYMTGIDRVLDLADALGYTTLGDRSRFGLALVLGGAEVKLLDHTAAFGTFAADGVRQEPVAILKVEDHTGKMLEEWKASEGERVLEEEVARQITNVLSDNEARTYVFGASNHLTLPGRPAAGKTGTTNDYRDAWMVGYTPSLVTGVWTGNNNNKEMKRGADGSQIAAPIWQAYMRAVLKDTPVESFPAPKPVSTGKQVLDGALMPEEEVAIDRSTGLRATDATPPSQIEMRKYKTVHDTLFWVDKDNPRGPVPQNPAADPQYNNWETAVQEWAKKQPDLLIEAPPTESDNVHTPENKPSIELISPTENQTISNRSFSVAVSVSARRGVARVAVAMDGQEFDETRSAPWSGPFTIPNRFSIGFHTLEVRVYDDVDNMASVSRTVNLTAPPGPIGARWLAPNVGARLSAANFPYTITAGIQDDSGISSITILATRESDGQVLDLGTVSDPGTRNVVVRWNAASPGTWRLSIRLNLNNGSSEAAQGIRTVIVE